MTPNSKFMCEHEGCDREATTEYAWFDADGDPYSYFGCDEHDSDNDWFEARPLDKDRCRICGSTEDGHYSNNAECDK